MVVFWSGQAISHGGFMEIESVEEDASRTVLYSGLENLKTW